MSRRVVPDAEPLWRALADPTRRAILDALRHGPRTTGALAGAFPTTRYTVMGHLDVLVDVGLVTVERRGRERLNHLNPVPLRQAYERWVRPLASTAADTVLGLEEALVTGGNAMIGMAPAMEVRAQHHVAADPARTWRTVMNLPQWWPRRWSEDQRLVFEPWVGGRLGPTAGSNPGGFDTGAEGELWGVLAALRPHRELVVDGAMGLPGPVLGQWRLQLEPVGATTTTVTVEHRVLGAVSEEDRDCYAAGWPDTLAALARCAQER
ncbi:metalloregulator ArsR/SmtB family transcription factor [Pseudonocardia sp. C8]|uniref:ArsR/SmtB family transcription factor n=1 Tax=Pseudonocardia sp. C8 TaxID=2762759 RepID=UPI0016432631|nr:metalloregulator ArsR/SmtB family transcription factor [Pseudonocardia sp. C8]MBC3189997.1 metalloregulator ArsR/SmtB family transcription factor [Pseudonocardia sp. C8]